MGPTLLAFGTRWDVLGVEAVGFGTVAWLTILPSASSLVVCSRGRALRIGETGQVPEIEVENLDDAAMLVPAHLVVAGGWQTRAVERSVVVPARSSARVPVKCVEAGRWAPRDERTGNVFQIADRTSVRTRWSTSLNMAEQLSRHGRFAAEQSAVWQHVEEELARTTEPSHTRSYEAYLRGVKRQHLEAARLAGAKPPAAANAIAVFPRGGGFWLEAYPSPEALAEQADDLLSDLFDAEVKHTTMSNDPPGVEGLLGALFRMPLRDVERLPGTLGSAAALSGTFDVSETARISAVSGAVLMVDGKLAHLAAGGPPGRDFVVSMGPRAARAAAEPGPDKPGQSTMESQKAAQPPSMVGPLMSSAKPVVGGDSPASPGPEPIAPVEPGAPAAPVNPPVAPSPPTVETAASESEPRLQVVRGSAPSTASSPRGVLGTGRLPVPQASRDGKVIPISFRAEPPSSPGDVPKVTRETMRAVYARARELLPTAPPAASAVQGYRLLRSLDGNVSWVDIRVSGDGYAVLGSHDRCDLVLPGDSGIWLRHLLATCVRVEGGAVALRLIDLKTDVPFFLEDDVAQWSVTANGPFAIRLGRHVICGFPLGPSLDEDGSSSPSSGTPAAVRALHAEVGRTRATSIDSGAVVAHAGALHEPFTVIPSAPVSQIHDLVLVAGAAASPDHVRVTLERGGMGASVEIPATALDAGVLLGRALNCFDGGLRRIFCDAVSRAHVLLLRDAEQVFALDLCTTNGTRFSGRRIRRHCLSDEGTALELGKKVLFRWHRRLGT